MYDIQAQHHPNGQIEHMESGEDSYDGYNEGGNATFGMECSILTPEVGRRRPYLPHLCFRHVIQLKEILKQV